MIDLNLTIPAAFLEGEERSGYYVSCKMKQVWAVEMDLLSEFLRVCKKNNLPCFVDAGTLLGTIRHRGFIPWDDDIDVCMIRKDYDRLVEIAEDEFQPPYKFQCYYTEDDYPRGHAQLRNVNTKAILEGERRFHFIFNQGIFIDIFVLDYVPQNPDERKKLERKVNLFTRILFSKTSHRKIKLGKSFIRDLITERMRFVPGSYRYYARRKDQALRKTPQSEYVAPLGFIFDTEKRIRLLELYKETIWLPFEFIEVPVPIGYDTYLKSRFGNYMELVQIPNTHGETIFDVDHPAGYDIEAQKDDEF